MPSLSSSSCTADELISNVKAAMQFFKANDFPIRLRASATLYYWLKNKLPEPLFQPESILTGVSISGLSCELDLGLEWYQAEVDYRSGKIEKMDIREGDKKCAPTFAAQ